MSKVYTKRGDNGTTTSFGGCKMSKSDPVSLAIGSLDALHASLGRLRRELEYCSSVEQRDHEYTSIKILALMLIVNFILGVTEVDLLLVNTVIAAASVGLLWVHQKHSATTTYDYNSLSGIVHYLCVDISQASANLSAGENESKIALTRFQDSQTHMLEHMIDNMTEELPELGNFIMYFHSGVGVAANDARVNCRYAERLIVSLQPERTIDSKLLTYMNRLSDALFMIARYGEYLENLEEVLLDRRDYVNELNQESDEDSEEGDDYEEEVEDDECEEEADDYEEEEVDDHEEAGDYEEEADSDHDKEEADDHEEAGEDPTKKITKRTITNALDNNRKRRRITTLTR